MEILKQAFARGLPTPTARFEQRTFSVKQGPLYPATGPFGEGLTPQKPAEVLLLEESSGGLVGAEQRCKCP